jgi:hypothetical protein
MSLVPCSPKKVLLAERAHCEGLGRTQARPKTYKAVTGLASCPAQLLTMTTSKATPSPVHQLTDRWIYILVDTLLALVLSSWSVS